MIGRLAWAALLLAVAAIISAAQLDRAARRQPALAASVPLIARGFASEQLATQAVQARDGAAALAEAQRLIRARPLPAEHLRLLAAAAALQADEPRALAALEAATRRGWRDPLAQLAAGQAALLQQQHAATAQRLSALFATGGAPEQTLLLAKALLAQRAGREAFAGQLQADLRWRSNALRALAPVIEPADLAETLALAQAGGAKLPCDVLGPLAERYEAEGRTGLAAQFWPGDCPAA